MKRFLHFAALVVLAVQLSIPQIGSAHTGTSGQDLAPGFDFQEKISESPCLTTCLRSFRDIVNCNTNKMVIEQIIEDGKSSGGLKNIINKFFKRN